MSTPKKARPLFWPHHFKHLGDEEFQVWITSQWAWPGFGLTNDANSSWVFSIAVGHWGQGLGSFPPLGESGLHFDSVWQLIDQYILRTLRCKKTLLRDFLRGSLKQRFADSGNLHYFGRKELIAEFFPLYLSGDHLAVKQHWLLKCKMVLSLRPRHLFLERSTYVYGIQ